jgi:hypothetical protein
VVNKIEIIRMKGRIIARLFINDLGVAKKEKKYAVNKANFFIN